MDKTAPNYYCTWQIIDWLPENSPEKGLDPRDFLSDKYLFGENGIAVKSYPETRKKLIFLLDDGWEVPRGSGDKKIWFRPYVGSAELQEDKFPGYGKTPAERLKTVSEKVKALGWRGLGLWISPGVAYGKGVSEREKDFKEYWAARLERSKEAGVLYWKVDWGDYALSDRHRKLMSEMKEKIYPDLTIEHAHTRAPVNKRGEESLFLPFLEQVQAFLFRRSALLRRRFPRPDTRDSLKSGGDFEISRKKQRSGPN
jgi:hypothetical protein